MKKQKSSFNPDLEKQKSYFNPDLEKQKSYFNPYYNAKQMYRTYTHTLKVPLIFISIFPSLFCPQCFWIVVFFDTIDNPVPQ